MCPMKSCTKYQIVNAKALLSVLILAAAGCSTVQAKTDFDRSANFSRYRTFKVLQGRMLSSENGAPPNTMVGDRIHDGITTELAARGLTPTDENPDLWVGYVAGARTREELQTVGPYPTMGPYMGPGWWGPATAWTTEYQHGTLVIDLIDAETKKMVWRAIVEADRNQLSDLGEPKLINKATAKAFKNFPPKP